MPRDKERKEIEHLRFERHLLASAMECVPRGVEDAVGETIAHGPI